MRYAQVSYELFDEIADKEFVVETQRYISTQTSRLLQAIAPFELTEVLDMVYAYEQIDDLKYFIEHIDTVQAVAKLQAQIHVSNAQQTIQYTLAIATSAIVALSWVLSPWLSLVLLVVGVALIVWYTQIQQQRAQKLRSLAQKV
jgi:Flp pilus assembly protein TadB